MTKINKNIKDELYIAVYETHRTDKTKAQLNNDYALIMAENFFKAESKARMKEYELEEEHTFEKSYHLLDVARVAYDGEEVDGYKITLTKI